MFIDSHAHLTDPELAPRLPEVLRNARVHAVTGIVCPGIEIETSRQALEIAERHPEVVPAAGIHPHEALGGADTATWRAFADLAADPRFVAVGECGLDYFRSLSPVEEQREVFRRQVRLARDLDRPLIVHSREAIADVLRILREEGEGRVRGVMHCFVEGKRWVEEVADVGFHMSFAGIVTYPKNGYLREAAAAVPESLLLIETDAPYLAPQPRRGKKNEPAFLRYTAETVAEVRGVDLNALAERTAANTRALFGEIPPSRPILAYRIGNALYLNLTQRCPTDCTFCPRDTRPWVQGHDLTLPREGEPDAAAVLAEAGDVSGYDEVVFCGFGESTMRLDVLLEVARGLKGKGKRLRLNTIGLGSVIHGRNIAPDLAAVLDAVSISLNTTDPEQYRRLCRPNTPGADLAAVESFIRDAAAVIPEVQVTAVDLPKVEMDRVARRARELGATFHGRPFNRLGVRPSPDA